jgi:hypothetical protein
MAKIKLTKSVVDAVSFRAKEYELRDTAVPGLLLKVTPAGRKIFMLQYRTNAGERRKPAIGRFGELTVEQARSIAQDWLADVRKGKDPGAEKKEQSERCWVRASRSLTIAGYELQGGPALRWQST